MYQIVVKGNRSYLVKVPAATVNPEEDIVEGMARLGIEESDAPKGAVYVIPLGADAQEVDLKIMTSLVYEAQRHDFNTSEACLHRREALELLNQKFRNWTLQNFIDCLWREETQRGRYYGSDCSDDSDSDDDKLREENPQAYHLKYDQILRAQQSSEFWKQTRRVTPRKAGITGKLRDLVTKLQEGTITSEETIISRLNDAAKAIRTPYKVSQIPYAAYKGLIKEQVDAINEINKIIKASRERGKFKNGEIARLRELAEKYKFFTVDFRGINYMLDRWNAPSRRYHRGMEEEFFSQFSEMVLKSLDFNFYTDLSEKTDYIQRKDLQMQLRRHAAEINRFLWELRDKGPVLDFSDRAKANPYLFNNILDRLQHSYTNGIRDFLQELTALRKQYPAFWGEKLPNADNPFVSAGHTYKHAGEYAGGGKTYYGQANRPRWHQSGKLEYSHVGKVYVFLVPVANYLLKDVPNNVPQMDREGRVVVERDISPEKEISYLTFVDGQYVIGQYVFKYPDFSHEEYPKIFETKYGISEEMYAYFKYFIQHYPPHSAVRVAVEDCIREWLCTYHEILLMRVAMQEAIDKEGTLVYMNQKGDLQTEPDKTLMRKGVANKPVRDDVHVQRNARRALAAQLATSANRVAFNGFTLLGQGALDDEVENLDVNAVIAKARARKHTLPTHTVMASQPNLRLWLSPSPATPDSPTSGLDDFPDTPYRTPPGSSTQKKASSPVPSLAAAYVDDVVDAIEALREHSAGSVKVSRVLAFLVGQIELTEGQRSTLQRDLTHLFSMGEGGDAEISDELSSEDIRSFLIAGGRPIQPVSLFPGESSGEQTVLSAALSTPGTLLVDNRERGESEEPASGKGKGAVKSPSAAQPKM